MASLFTTSSGRSSRHWADRLRQRIGDATVAGFIALIRLYRIGVRPLLGGACRYAPSCSSYAEDALRHHGAVRGLRLTGARVLRCHPWSAGGYDPVPGGQKH